VDRNGSALVISLVALVSAALAAVLLHLLAVDQLHMARVSLASARAREAAATGLHFGTAGLGAMGTLPGGASWQVVADTIAPGLIIFWSTGQASRPSVARLEVGAIQSSADTSSSAATAFQPGWIVMRYD